MSKFDFMESLPSEVNQRVMDCINYLAWTGAIKRPYGYAIGKRKGRWGVCIWPQRESVIQNKKGGGQLVDEFGKRQFFPLEDILADGEAAEKELKYREATDAIKIVKA